MTNAIRNITWIGICLLVMGPCMAKDLPSAVPAPNGEAPAANKSIKVFVLAGDECVLENAPIAYKDKQGQAGVGSLERMVSAESKYGFLKDKQGNWVQRDDVLLYDAHPTKNNTRAPGTPIKIGVLG